MRLKYFFLFLFTVACHTFLFSRQEVLPVLCDTLSKQDTGNSTEKDSLVKLIKSKDNFCRWKDQGSGFSIKTARLMKITSLQEKIELFNDSSVILKCYLFPAILYENDSVGFSLLRKYITDTTVLVSLCSCVVEDDPVNLRLAYFYYSFIQLKYYWNTSGTVSGVSFRFDHHYGKRIHKKIWDQKRTEFKSLVSYSIPGFKKYLSPSAQKAWD
jgi:hypothetical protein